MPNLFSAWAPATANAQHAAAAPLTIRPRQADFSDLTFAPTRTIRHDALDKAYRLRQCE
jgi:hypothetical protein